MSQSPKYCIGGRCGAAIDVDGPGKLTYGADYGRIAWKNFVGVNR